MEKKKRWQSVFGTTKEQALSDHETANQTVFMSYADELLTTLGHAFPKNK